jgi:hypothetical protein
MDLVPTHEGIQQNVSPHGMWFHWILNEFIGPNEQDLVGM